MDVMESLQVVQDLLDLCCLCSALVHAGLYSPILFVCFLKVIENFKVVQWTVGRSTLLLLNLQYLRHN